MTALLDTLSQEQRAAVEAMGTFTSVSAGPGAGKTRVLAARIAWLIDQGADPRQLCALVFTRNAAAEIRERLFPVIGHIVGMIEVSTFHSLAARHVVPEGFRVATETEAEAALRSLYEGPTRRSRGLPGIETVRRGLMAHESACFAPHHERDAVSIVRHRLLEARLIPTWDLVPLFLEDGVAFPDKLPLFDHVLCDESQDVTRNEVEMAAGLRDVGGTLFTVGDPRQAIFGWRGARPEAWRGLMIPHTELGIRQTFRFGPAIATLANSIAARFGGDPIVGSPDVQSTVHYADSLEIALTCADLPHTAILCRTNIECQEIAAAFPDQVEWVRRDPMDPFAHETDRFAAAAERGRAVVSTIHSAKGAEWDSVILALDLDSKAKDEESDRVRYVAVSRARRRLTILGGPR